MTRCRPTSHRLKTPLRDRTGDARSNVLERRVPVRCSARKAARRQTPETTIRPAQWNRGPRPSGLRRAGPRPAERRSREPGRPRQTLRSRPAERRSWRGSRYRHARARRTVRVDFRALLALERTTLRIGVIIDPQPVSIRAAVPSCDINPAVQISSRGIYVCDPSDITRRRQSAACAYPRMRVNHRNGNTSCLTPIRVHWHRWMRAIPIPFIIKNGITPLNGCDCHRPVAAFADQSTVLAICKIWFSVLAHGSRGHSPKRLRRSRVGVPLQGRRRIGAGVGAEVVQCGFSLIVHSVRDHDLRATGERVGGSRLR